MSVDRVVFLYVPAQTGAQALPRASVRERDLDAERPALNALAALDGEHVCAMCERRLPYAAFSASDPDRCALCADLLGAHVTDDQRAQERQDRSDLLALERQDRPDLLALERDHPPRSYNTFTRAEKQAAYRPGRFCRECNRALTPTRAAFGRSSEGAYLRDVCAKCARKPAQQEYTRRWKEKKKQKTEDADAAGKT